MDSPRCIKCIEAGLIGQTYKMACKQLYKCQSCSTVYERAMFLESDFNWRSSNDWAKGLSDKMKQQNNKVGQKRLGEMVANDAMLRGNR